MHAVESSQRVLFLSQCDDELDQLFQDPALAEWRSVRVENSGAAALLQQSNPCGLLIADQNHYQQEDLEGIAWLARNQSVPIVLVADVPADTVAAAYSKGIAGWVSREQALSHPSLLAATIRHAQDRGQMQRRLHQTKRALEQSRHQIDRLVTLLWRTGPMEIEQRWYSQRHMLERLGEEISRAQRHGTPVTIAMGEVAPQSTSSKESVNDLEFWTAEQVTQQKRRSDIAGQYGLNNFLLLMTHTPITGGRICCERLRSHLEQSAAHQGPHGPIHSFFGLASFSSRATTSQRLLRQAEENLLQAKTCTADSIVAE